jgi:ATP-dependent Clp protease ATP-binding subunit ClpA
VLRTKRDAIGPEHLLLAVLRLEDSTARRLVQGAGVDPQAWIRAIDDLAGTGTVTEAPQQLPFTPRGQQTMQVLVQIVGSTLFHRTIGTEHLLVALLQDPEGLAVKSLERAGGSREAIGRPLSEHLKSLPVDEQLRAQAEALRAQAEAARAQQQAPAGRGGPGAGGFGSLSPAAQRVLQSAGQQAHELRHTQVGTVHLLLALVADPDRMANNVFLRLGVRPEDVRNELLRQLRADEGAAVAAAQA